MEDGGAGKDGRSELRDPYRNDIYVSTTEEDGVSQSHSKSDSDRREWCMAGVLYSTHFTTMMPIYGIQLVAQKSSEEARACTHTHTHTHTHTPVIQASLNSLSQN